MSFHTASRKGVLYVGSAGTGKTTIVLDYFSQMDPESVLSAGINFNSFTDSKALKVVIESQADKRA